MKNETPRKSAKSLRNEQPKEAAWYELRSFRSHDGPVMWMFSLAGDGAPKDLVARLSRESAVEAGIEYAAEHYPARCPPTVVLAAWRAKNPLKVSP